VRELDERGKHRTEVTEAAEGDFAVGGQNSIGNGLASWARITYNGKHRTEVTEGGFGRWPKFYRYHHRAIMRRQVVVPFAGIGPVHRGSFPSMW
jgi:hypothetical protein